MGSVLLDSLEVPLYVGMLSGIAFLLSQDKRNGIEIKASDSVSYGWIQLLWSGTMIWWFSINRNQYFLQSDTIAVFFLLH